MLEGLKTKISRLLPKGSAVHSVFLLAGGTTIAQALGILTMPVFSRIYSPGDFGVLALFTSITSILVELSGLRYYLAIPLPKKNAFARSLVVLSFFIQCVFIALLSVFLLLAKDWILPLISADLLEPYWFLIPLGVGGMGFYLMLTQWAVREKEFSLIAKTRLTQSLSGIVTKLVLGLMGVKPLGLILGAIASQAGGVTSLAKRLIGKNGIPEVDRTQIKRVTIRYRKFPIYDTWGGVLNTLGRQIIPILLVALYSPEIAGFFAFGMQILQLPATFIGQAIGQVFVQKASVAKYDGNLAEVSLKTFKALLRIGTFPILCLGLLAPDLFSFFFGEQWRMAGEFSRYLAPWLLLDFIHSPLSLLFHVLGRQRTYLIFHAVSLPIYAISIWLGAIFESSLASIVFLSVFGSVFLMVLILYLMLESQNDIKNIGRIFCRELALSILGLFLLFFSYFLDLSFYSKLISFVFGSAFYLFMR